MRKIHIQEYKDYLKKTQGSIHKILPLYEDLELLFDPDNVSPQYKTAKSNLCTYVLSLYREVENVKETIDCMPNGAWYFSTRSGLKTLTEDIIVTDNHKTVKHLVFHLTGLIQQQIVMIEE